MDKPLAIAVDPVAGFLVFTDRGRMPKIERTQLDGSNRRVLVNESIVFPSGLSLDYKENQIYWCDTRLDTIGKKKVFVMFAMRVIGFEFGNSFLIFF